MKRIALLFLCCCLSCSQKPKVKKQTTQQNAKAVKEVNTTPIIEISKEEMIKTERKKPQIKLDYSLKAERIKTLKDSVNYLKHYFNQFLNTKDSLSEVLFFKMFPASFKNYNRLYGFGYGKAGERNPLLPSHIYYEFYQPINISKEEYIEKLVANGINGKWDADGVNMFKMTLHKKWSSDFILFDEILRTKTQQEIQSFWVFFFDGPHPYHPLTVESYNNVLKKLETIDPEMVLLVEQAYAFVKENWGDHGH